MINSKSEKRVRALSHVVLILFSLGAVIPFVIMLSASVSNDKEILMKGYTLYPRGIDFTAFQFIFSGASTVMRAYLITILVTVAGTALSLMITSLAGYVLSKDWLPLGKLLSFIVIFTMLFNGGLVPTYYVYTRVFNLKDTLLALIIPGLLMNAFNVMLVRNYHRSNIPPSILESVELDGASAYRAYFSIALPLSLPITATVGLLTAIMYWNDWQNGLYYLTGTKFYSIQQVLRVMSTQTQYLAQVSGSKGVDRQLPTTTIRMAIASIAILPIIIAYPFFQKYYVKGIVIGAVKE